MSKTIVRSIQFTVVEYTKISLKGEEVVTSPKQKITLEGKRTKAQILKHLKLKEGEQLVIISTDVIQKKFEIDYNIFMQHAREIIDIKNTNII